MALIAFIRASSVSLQRAMLEAKSWIAPRPILLQPLHTTRSTVSIATSPLHASRSANRPRCALRETR